jgi:hypothetical protein
MPLFSWFLTRVYHVPVNVISQEAIQEVMDKRDGYTAAFTNPSVDGWLNPAALLVRNRPHEFVGYTAGGNAYPRRPPFALRAEPSLR